ncbi:hypothetical protein RHODOSMS8_03714 [Rhodobiaceae bacterium]|nr:hypothetical protein RHODOSMS8_03714 [Rhodobiaceae bacterium]
MARGARMSDKPAPIMPRSAQLLGYGGVIPFVGTSVVIWTMWPSEMGQTALQAQLVYAAIILSFLGGIRWGSVMQRLGHFKRRAPEGLARELSLSVVPPVVAWIALFGPAEAALVVFFLFFVAQAISDFRAVRSGEAPDWYQPLRLQLTFFVCAALIASLVRLVIA